ncbi:MAG: tRNA pseudouridine(13) synthase TruD [Candidatus Nanohaloarchaeota archaeon QJJ-9]|nr:tRNA pseudouridine(13) synthase TruD [Candidatus Nanohaloarchaeota archaeon QJJ-9]
MEEKIPEWSYYSDTRGLGGKIKEQIEDFKVEEIAEHETDGGNHVICRIKKHNMTTMETIKKLSNVLHISRERFGYAGNKDKRAVTTQYISVEGMDEEDLQQVFIPNLELEVLGKDDRIGLGNLEGNRFEVVVRNINLPEEVVGDRIDGITDELDGYIPNYFGNQRFGSVRPITHLVGKLILQGKFEEAVWTYIAKPYDEEHDKVRKVREDLWETRDPERGAEKFPKRYRYEKMLLYHLVKTGDDYTGAIKRLPEGLQNLFIHAFQSYIFNKALSSLIEDGYNDTDGELPLVGYKTALRDSKGDQKIKQVLEEEEIELDDFKLRDISHLSTEGEYRECFVPIKSLSLEEVFEDDLNINKNAADLEFNLGKGCYATVFLRELMKGG